VAAIRLVDALANPQCAAAAPTPPCAQGFACACAAGVGATFGTPFGGTLFSIEITSTFFMVSHGCPANLLGAAKA